MGPLLYRFDIATNALADLIFLGGHALAIGQQCLILSQVHNHIRTLKSTHRPTDNIPNAILELVEYHRLLCAADMLHQGLLGILSRNSPKTDWRDFDFHFLARLGIGLNPSGIKNRD